MVLMVTSCEQGLGLEVRLLHKMTVLEISLLIATGAFAGGFLGALTGLGGGVVVVPLLTVVFGVDLRYAVGTSLVAIVATSSGAAAAYVKEGYTNLRVGMLLEIATVTGALIAAYLSALIAPSAIAILFGVVLLFSAAQSFQQRTDRVSDTSDALAARLNLGSTYPTAAGLTRYGVAHVPVGFALMFVAGVLSALLGIGAGAIKVLAMGRAMRMPFKVSTTTSNFMIGVTAAASGGVYLARGYIHPELAFPVILGVLAGAMLGARVLTVAKTRTLRAVFTGVLAVLATEMLYKGLRGAL
jgi:uncharacterized membrane protein YfcA